MESKNFLDGRWSEPKFIISALGMLLLAGIIVVAIIQDRFTNQMQNQVSVSGQGKVAYLPDIATVNLGVQIDKVTTAEEALSKLNTKMEEVIKTLKEVGVNEKNIQTQNYSLYPQYDYNEGRSNVSGYNANQQLSVKIENIQENREMVGRIISGANKAGVNNILGVSYDVSSISDLKQRARVEAINDAKRKSGDLANAAGVKLGRIVSWYENIIKSPDFQGYQGMGGMGGDALSAKESSIQPTVSQLPSGEQEIVIEVNVNFQIK